MNIDHIINLVKSVPRDKWSDELTIKHLIKTSAEESGRTYTEDELNHYVSLFKTFTEELTPSALISMLLKKGISKSQLDTIKEKMNTQ